jgi:hypothetical protein
VRQAIALLVTAGLVVGGLVSGDVIGAETTPEAAPPEAATTETESPSEEEAEREPKRDATTQNGQRRSDRGVQPNRQRFCAVSAQLERAGRRTFGNLEAQANPPAAKIRKAERRFATQNRQLLGEAQQVAPRPLQGEVKTLVAAIRARAGLAGQAPSRQEARAAERRVSDFERRNCRSR